MWQYVELSMFVVVVVLLALACEIASVFILSNYNYT